MSLVNAETGEVVVECSEDEARDLTERIRSTADALWALLLEAHERRAWSALGYESFVGYASAEFGMGQSHAYRLLDQGRVVREIEEAVAEVIDLDSPDGETTPPLVNVTEPEARDIKPHLAEVKAAVAEAIEAEEDPTPERVTEIVQTTVRTTRANHAPTRKSDHSVAFAALARLTSASNAFLSVSTPDAMAELSPDEWQSFQSIGRTLTHVNERITEGGRRRRRLHAIEGEAR